jgi:FkbM family methyltransferase
MIMINAIKRLVREAPVLRHAYALAATRYNIFCTNIAAKRLFVNPDEFLQALERKETGTVVLRTHDGLSITIRRNIWDARIIREIFIRKPYIRRLTLPPSPIIVDIGGYVGDFSIYAVKYLNAPRVIVYEPMAENFGILKQNVENNSFQDRITAVNKAVSDSDEIVLNTEILDHEEVHASRYWYQHAERRSIRSVTLVELFESHQLGSVDLLKVDCEGGEYDILSSVPAGLFSHIRNIVFEYHEIEGFKAKLDRVLSRLRSADYTVQVDERIVSAYRPRL